MGRQTTVGLSTTAIFSVFADYFFGYFRDEASVNIWRYAVRRWLLVIVKCITLNDLEWLLRVKFCFRAGLAGSDRATWNEDRLATQCHTVTVSGANHRSDSIVPGNIRFVLIFARVL